MSESADVIHSRVLVLNRHYQPIHVTDVKRAFTMMYLDVARAIDGEFRVFDFTTWAKQAPPRGEKGLHTVSRIFRVPRVILLTTYDRMPIGQVRFSRQNVFIRDNYTCQYCHQQMRQHDLNLDHVMPRSRGGKTSWENVVCCCVPCNLRKGRRTPDEAGFRLLRAPARPRWSTFIHRPSERTHEADWKPYLAPFAAGKS